MTETKINQWDISVLVIEPNDKKRRRIEDVLEYVGLSGRGLRKFVSGVERAKIALQEKEYHFVIGDLPPDVQLNPDQIHIDHPDLDHVDGYLNFQSSLATYLEQRFGFDYDY